MPHKKKRSQRLWHKLSNKYRLVVLNDETFEEKASVRLSRINLFMVASSVMVIVVGLIFSVIIFTPLKEYIPGYADVTLRKELMALKLRADSLETTIQQRELWIQNIRNIVEGNIDTSALEEQAPPEHYDAIDLNEIPTEDKQLRKEIESEEHYSLIFAEQQDLSKSMTRLHFFPPIKGYITNAFDPDKEHYGIDLVAPEQESIRATLDGTVVMATWTLETGYVLGIQHEDNLMSFYKHNSVLFKKVGNFVTAGEVIAIVGSSGELTTGPHLHFEIWKDGLPVDPEQYIVF